jgi:hypothetical protein
VINEDRTITITVTLDQLNRLIHVVDNYQMRKPDDDELLVTLIEQRDTH